MLIVRVMDVQTHTDWFRGKEEGLLEEIQEVEKECQKRRHELFACEHESNQTLKSLEAAIEEARQERRRDEQELKETQQKLKTLKTKVVWMDGIGSFGDVRVRS